MLLLDVGECVGKVSGPVIFVVFLGEKPKEIFEGLATMKFKSLLIGSKGAVELMILDTTVTIEGLVMVFYAALLVLIVYLDLGCARSFAWACFPGSGHAHTVVLWHAPCFQLLLRDVAMLAAKEVADVLQTESNGGGGYLDCPDKH